MTAHFDFRDMKYLSQKQTFISDPIDANVVGTSKGSVKIDFNKLSELDATGNSRYIVGGRTYFEASVFSS